MKTSCFQGTTASVIKVHNPGRISSPAEDSVQEFLNTETSNQGSLCSDYENSFGDNLSVSLSSQLNTVEFKVLPYQVMRGGNIQGRNAGGTSAQLSFVLAIIIIFRCGST